MNPNNTPIEKNGNHGNMLVTNAKADNTNIVIDNEMSTLGCRNNCFVSVSPRL